MTGVNLNYEGTKLKLDGSVRWNHSDVDAFSKVSRQIIYSETQSQFSNSLSQNFSRTNAWNAQMRLEWTPDSMTNIMFRPSFRYNSNDGDNNSLEASFTDDPYKYVKTVDLYTLDGLKDYTQNKRDQTNVSYSDSKNINGMLQFNRRLSNTGRNITLQLNAGWSDGDSKSISNSWIDYYTKGIITNVDTINRYSITPTKNWNYSARRTGTIAHASLIASQSCLAPTCSSAISISIAIRRAIVALTTSANCLSSQVSGKEASARGIPISISSALRISSLIRILTRAATQSIRTTSTPLRLCFA